MVIVLHLQYNSQTISSTCFALRISSFEILSTVKSSKYFAKKFECIINAGMHSLLPKRHLGLLLLRISHGLKWAISI